MNAFRLILAVVAMATATGPAFGQDNAAQAPPPSESVGPRELENFSLEGRVTRPAEETARPVPNTVRADPPPARSETPARREAPAAAADSAVERPAETSRAGELLARPPTRPQPQAAAPAQAEPAPSAPRPALVTDAPQQGGSSLLMWVAALLFAGGAAAIYWFLRHGRQRPATAGGYRSGYAARAMAEPEPIPAPLPRAATPPAPSPTPAQRPLPTTLRPKPDLPVSSAPPAAAPPSKPVGIVASSLRPWIDVELTPDRALVDDKGAAIAFNVTLVNSGSAPARDVSIEALLLNAGARQDVELSDFYQKPKASSDSIPVIAPMARVPLRTAVKIPREMIHEYEVEGRKLFMPMVAVSTRYRWSSGEGQTGASFLVGRGQEAQERLAPLRIDQ
ncbi:MAG TPA: hypothetical protein VFO42_07520, partial [Sphingomicrobium sp.]|nr:hypothetical protein [Sphingomicrobium sp.]